MNRDRGGRDIGLCRTGRFLRDLFQRDPKVVPHLAHTKAVARALVLVGVVGEDAPAPPRTPPLRLRLGHERSSYLPPAETHPLRIAQATSSVFVRTSSRRMMAPTWV